MVVGGSPPVRVGRRQAQCEERVALRSYSFFGFESHMNVVSP
jgi:hypothetical protein